MKDNVTMKALILTIGIVISLVGVVFKLTLSTQADTNARFERRLDKIEDTVNQLPQQNAAILESLGRIDERLKNLERK